MRCEQRHAECRARRDWRDCAPWHGAACSGSEVVGSRGSGLICATLSTSGGACAVVCRLGAAAPTLRARDNHGQLGALLIWRSGRNQSGN
jgi:hypothetical protein